MNRPEGSGPTNLSPAMNPTAVRIRGAMVLTASILVVLSAGCVSPTPIGSTGSPQATPSPIPTPTPTVRPSPVSATNLTSVWVLGYPPHEQEPSAGPLPDCKNGARVVVLGQEGNTLSGNENRYGDLPCDFAARIFHGTNVNGKITLESKQFSPLSGTTFISNYDLTFDPKSEHLTGTVTDSTGATKAAPVWLAQLACPWPLPSQMKCGRL